MTSIAGQWFPSRAGLDAATARTAVAIADSGSSLADVEFAADVEEVTFLVPGADRCHRRAPGRG